MECTGGERKGMSVKMSEGRATEWRERRRGCVERCIVRLGARERA